MLSPAPGPARGPALTPARLRSGDTVALVAPAGPVPRHLLDAGVDVLRSWGLRVVVGDHVLDRHPDLGYLAGVDADRAAELQHYWCSPGVDAVLCARGGYGSIRMIDELDLAAMAKAMEVNGPRLFVGSSDITALHQIIGTRLNLSTLFGPMVATETFTGRNPAAREHLRATLFEPETVRVLGGPAATTLVPGRARGRIVGGNASLLAGTLGAPGGERPPAGSIAVLEDVTEHPYRLDRILTQLRRAGWFDGVAGIALGSWRECGDPAEVAAMLADVLVRLGVPTIGEHGFGHVPDTFTVPLGAEAELDADAGTLTLDAAALR